MLEKGLDINVAVTIVAKTIAEGQSKEEIIFAIHFLSLLQNALKSYIL